MHAQHIANLASKAQFKKKPPRYFTFHSYMPYGKYKGQKASIIAQRDPHYLLNYFLPFLKIAIEPVFKNYIQNINFNNK